MNTIDIALSEVKKLFDECLSLKVINKYYLIFTAIFI